MTGKTTKQQLSSLLLQQQICKENFQLTLMNRVVRTKLAIKAVYAKYFKVMKKVSATLLCLLRHLEN
jgi:hypothetical protein